MAGGRGRRIAVPAAVLAVALGLAGCSALKGGGDARPANKPSGSGKIEGLLNVRRDDPGSLTTAHKPGKLTYKQSPPVGGDHNRVWQNCSGDVYSAPIANENAVHSLEHGAVWITYRPGLDEQELHILTAKVRSRDFMMLSPYEALRSKITLQAWGYQLEVAAADDPRIDAFIAKYRRTATLEPGAPCTDGTTETGTEPKNA
jgi:hypothetical protein